MSIIWKRPKIDKLLLSIKQWFIHMAMKFPSSISASLKCAKLRIKGDFPCRVTTRKTWTTKTFHNLSIWCESDVCAVNVNARCDLTMIWVLSMPLTNNKCWCFFIHENHERFLIQISFFRRFQKSSLFDPWNPFMNPH